MDQLDYDDPHRPQGWRFTLTIAAEAAKEAGRVILGQMYDTFCMWIAFVMVMLIQVIPLFITLYLVQLVVPDYVNKIHWMILVIPGILLTYLMRSLFQTILNVFNRFAEKQWGRAYRRRLPKWLITKNLRDTTKNLVSDFDGLVWFFKGIVSLPYYAWKYLRTSREQDGPSGCTACRCFNLEESYASLSRQSTTFFEVAQARWSCATCAIIYAGVRRFYPPKGTTNRYFRSWKRYSGYEEIFLHWDPDKRSIRVDLEASWDSGPSLTFYCIGKGPDLPIISPPLAYVDDTRSEASIHRAFDWILKCTTEHEFCPKNEPKPMPDRVLDLGVSNDSPVKLVETHNRLGTYACLSHRWGSIQPLQTLKANKEAHKLGIPLEALPKTFQDVVNVCRQLSIRYLWADTLCIIQDSNDDWQRQAVEMANIYENSYLTIAATKASGHHEGLHPEEEIRETRIEHIPASAISQGVSQDIYVRLDFPNRYYRNRVQHWSSIGTEQLNAHEWPLLTRAWVFQERLLSPRMLHFASRELVWECRTEVYCDCGYDHKSNDNLDFKRLVSTQSIKTSDCTPQQLRHLWYAIVERYSLVMGNLTKQTDVFPALSGLASRIAGLLGEEYAAGLWRSNIVEGLLWIPGFKMPIQGQRRPSQWVAPTWSWASVLGDVSYQYRIRSDSYNKKELQEVYASVVDVSCSSTGSQTTGAISAAVLTLSGCVMYGTIRFRTERDSVGYLGMERVYTYTSVIWNHNGDWDKFEPDHPEDIVEGQQVLCMRLARIGGQEWYIVLTEVYDGSGRFKRVGLLEGLDVTWKWFTPRSWRKRVENRYFEERREVRIV
ncbi:heterokaryon incompatibility [Fusarium albosuccineum]|uniref:Heterokaryon incompatibility n=1 Tax=Fusarium albosuccineum TaxID=1237068 RepID=A0A8H4L5N0_9HYPO|nr:heterokaryon incompatibility [Fusarium albosuccineum]